MNFSFFKPKPFEPNFPIIPLYATEEEAQRLLEQHAPVAIKDPESDSTIAQKLLVAATEETRISVGIWNGRVRFTNYLTAQFNDTDKERGRKLAWFVKQYGGEGEFDKPWDTPYMVFWKNPVRKIMIVFGLHLGPVRVIDQDPEHWEESGE
jgi:hypothetical protein